MKPTAKVTLIEKHIAPDYNHWYGFANGLLNATTLEESSFRSSESITVRYMKPSSPNTVPAL